MLKRITCKSVKISDSPQHTIQFSWKFHSFNRDEGSDIGNFKSRIVVQGQENREKEDLVYANKIFFLVVFISLKYIKVILQ